MSDTLEVIKAEEAEITRLSKSLAIDLDALREEVCDVARRGAELGRHVEGWKHDAKIKSDDEFWRKLAKLSPAIRRDVIHFAVRAAAAQRKCAALDDPSQLTFILAAPGEQGGVDRQAPQPRETNELMLLTTQCQRTLGFIREWQERMPFAQWPATVRQSARDAIEPLVKLWEELA